MNLRQAIVFAILMENRNGIVGKAPSYVEEKLASCGKMEYPEGLLDAPNLAKFIEWQQTWGMEFEEEKA